MRKLESDGGARRLPALHRGFSVPGAVLPGEDGALIEIRDQCRKDKVAFFFKQWGGVRPKSGGRRLSGREWNQYKALRSNARDRANAKERERESKTGASDLFAGVEANVQELTIDEIVEEQKLLAAKEILEMLHHLALDFSLICSAILQAYMLRVTNVKDICVDLAKAGKIENTRGRRESKASR